MKKFGKILVWLLIIIAALAIIAYLLPRQYTVKRSITIVAKRSLVYALTCDLKKWNLWSPWTKKVDTSVIFEYSGNACEVGTRWKWDGKMLGNGELVVTAVDPDKLLTYDLLFDKGKFMSRGSLAYTNVNDSVLVIWSDEGDLGYNPFARYMGLFIDGMMGSEFERGLSKLKAVAEERNTWPFIEEQIVGKQIMLTIRDSAGSDTYGQVMGKGYNEIMGFITKNKLTPVGHPAAIYISWDSTTMFSVFDLAIAIENSVPVEGRITIRETPEQKMLVADYFGAYDKTYMAYNALEKYAVQGGLEICGNPWEIYITDPMTEPDTAKWETKVLFPIK